MVKRYPAYKHSGTEWLGNVPSGWQILRLKDVSWITPSNVDKKSYDGQLSVRLCNYTDVYYNEQITNDMDLMAATADPEEIRKFSLRAGQVIITKDSESAADIGIAAFVPKDLPGVVCGYHLSVIQCTDKAEGRFIKRLFDSTYVKSVLATRANGLTRVGLGQAALATIPIPVPPVDEQRQIADYLDAQTAKIDALIGKQERLIETLAERRQAVISHAVTKGLDPNAPMRDSGVRWLGLVPASWIVAPIRRMATRITDGAHISPETEGGVFDFVSTKDVRADGIDFEGALKTSPASFEFLVRNGCQPVLGDVLFSKDGTVGRSVLVATTHPFVVASSLIIVRPDLSAAKPLFLNYLFQSRQVQEQVRSFVKGAGLPRLSITNLLKIIGVFPGLQEQMEIAEHLDRETSQIDALSAKAREMIDVLKERRQALISAAVTGKIDVRGLA